jgi:glycosyltransferase involved in cell wall biosynthesis/sulfatase maturation enzyme AslB (radical SAM superfamily)
MLLLSVVIPTFNRARSAINAIENYFLSLQSLADLTNTAIEFIIVDDRSVDDTYNSLVNRFKLDKNIRVLQTEKNVGPGLARELGLKSAKGEWVWFLDDDDEIHTDLLSPLLDFIKNTSLDIDVVAHSLKNKYYPLSQKNRNTVAKNILFFHEFQEVFRYIFRRRLVDQNNIHFSDGFHEDIRYVFELILKSSSVAIFDGEVYSKNHSLYAITAKMNTVRIDGFINAYNEIACLMQEGAKDFAGYKQNTLNQFLGVLLYLIAKEPNNNNAISFLKHLRLSSCVADIWSSDISTSPKYASISTNFKYAGSLWRHSNRVESQQLLDDIRGVFNTRLSCKDLDSSIFLGPDEIRACCKRFFSKGIQKGDVVLLKADASIGFTDIQTAKDALIARINADNAPECSGCPYIERRDPNQSETNYVSLENFSYCNMRCTYCSPKYYGGTEAKYNATEIIQKLAETPQKLGSNCHVVWGGGEPTLSPRFDAINSTLMTLPQVGKIRVLSNSLRFSETLAKNLNDSHFHLVTSIDAGTQDTFKKIRGVGNLDKVLQNLERYRDQTPDPHRITVKYIICADNFTSVELQNYVQRISQSRLKDCLFQISCDFTVDKAADEMICGIYELAIRLKASGINTVFFDDLIRDRIKIDVRLYEIILKHLKSLNLTDTFILTANPSQQIVLWGDGKQAEWLLKSTAAGLRGQIVGIISGESQWFGSEFEKQSNILLYPAGVQSMYEILNNIDKSGLSDRVFNGILI